MKNGKKKFIFTSNNKGMKNSPNIEVGILKAKKPEFRLAGKFEVSGQIENFFGNCSAEVIDNKIIVKNEGKVYSFPDGLTFIPCNITSDYFELKDVVIGIDFHWEQKEVQKFQGALKLFADKGKIRVVNIIPIENYLYSVISSEMNAESSPELLKAHAIISRSWLMAQINREGTEKKKSDNEIKDSSDEEYIRWFDKEDHEKFHVCADDHCQRYQGISRATNFHVIEAVNETRGRVLTYNNRICDARYSKCCGGKTESFENCWEEVNYPYLTSIMDNSDEKGYSEDLRKEEAARNFINDPPEAFCDTKDDAILQQVLNDYDRSTKDYFRWEVHYSQRDISDIILKRSGIDFGRIKDLQALERGHSGRLIRMKITGEKKSLVIGKELLIRKWLSNSHLYSSAFFIEKEGETDGYPEKFILKGAGWGHGVGLCQIGAAVMSEKGYGYEEILKHYYKNATISRLYS